MCHAPLAQAILAEAPDLLTGRVLNLLDGAAPLQLAAKRGHAEAVQALIDAGADVEGEDGQGHTALKVRLSDTEAHSGGGIESHTTCQHML